MTPSQYIEAMGAGWNLGSNYDGSWYDKNNNKYRYWCCNGNWKYKINSGSYTAITVFKEQWSTTDNLQSFKFSFTPTDDTVNITLQHPFITATTETLPIKIISATVAGTTTATLINALTFPVFSERTSTLTIDLTTIFSESVLNNAVVLNVKIDSDNLSYYPTSDTSVLSSIRKYIITRVISASGFQDVREVVIKAVAAAGFKSIRIPIMWYGHSDVLSDGHVHVDTEFLDHLATVLGWCHNEGLLVCINMHHDDNTRDMHGWLTTTQYLADPTVPVTYKDIWEQVATYFKDYGDWLSFASNNETLDDSKHWENPGTADVWALKQMQKDFYDTVRAIPGNETRICIYPTYAAKASCLNSTWIDPSDSSNTGKWNLPYDDAYGIGEIHPYAGSAISTVRSLAKAAMNKHIPIIYGEFGNGSWNDKETCWVTAYQVGLACYYGQGTFIWDDDGGMRILNRRGVTASNYAKESLWAGYLNEFIKSLTKNAPLREAEILLNNRRQSAYMGDTVSICLDTDKHVYVSNEGSDNASVTNGNQVKVGQTDIHDLLAISYDGEYNTIDIEVDMPEHWTSASYDDAAEWEHGAWNIYPQEGVEKISKSPIHSGYLCLRHSELIEIDPNTAVYVKWKTSTGATTLYIVEFDSGKNMLTTHTTVGELISDGETPYYPKSNAKYLAVWFEGGPNWQPEWYSSCHLNVYTRDTSQTEEKDLTDSYVDSITDYKNYYVSIYRTVNVSGGMEYELDFGSAACDVHIMEYNGTKLEADYWVQNGDTIATNLFTKSMRIEIEVPNADIDKVIKAMNDGALRPTLAYTDYATHVPEYDEEFTPIQTEKKHGLVTVGGKLIKCDGKFIKI